MYEAISIRKSRRKSGGGESGRNERVEMSNLRSLCALGFPQSECAKVESSIFEVYRLYVKYAGNSSV